MSLRNVLVVPGFSGSLLTRSLTPFSPVPQVTIWPDPVKLAWGEWSWMALADDGVSPRVSWHWKLTPGMPIPAYYGTLATRLAAAGYNVVSMSTDWRLAMHNDGLRVAEALRALGRDEPCDIVCHSRGGLVVRWALGALAATGELSRVGRVAALGTPHYGTWDAPAAVAEWAEFVQLLGWTLYGVSLLTNAVPWAGYLGDVIRTWPAIYELFPAPAYPGLFPGQAGMIYSAASWSAIRVIPPQSWLTQALSNWAALPAPPSNVDWVDVRGTGLPTPISLIPGHMPGSRADLTYSNAGDGSVALISSGAPGRRSIYTPSSHVAMVYDGRVIAAVTDFLANGLTADRVIAGAVLGPPDGPPGG